MPVVSVRPGGTPHLSLPLNGKMWCLQCCLEIKEPFLHGENVPDVKTRATRHREREREGGDDVVKFPRPEIHRGPDIIPHYLFYGLINLRRTVLKIIRNL